jgi:Tol biopolymer transport system component
MGEGKALGELGLRLLAMGAVLFGLSCSGGDISAPTTGSLEITTATSGPEPDPDGYTVAIDDGAETAIGVNGTLRRDNLETGNHTIRLAGLAPNCTVEGENPRAVGMTAGDTVAVSFSITCEASTGSLEVTTITTGSLPDPDGYTLSLDAGTAQAIGINATVTLGNLAAGPHSVALSGVAPNCQVAGDNPRAITVTTGTTVTATFSIACHLTQGSKIAFLRRNSDGSSDIFVMNTDGTGQRNLTPGTSDNTFACGLRQRYVLPVCHAWSPDGTKLVFTRCCDTQFHHEAIFVMNADGSGQTDLTQYAENDSDPAWSPDGQKIAFERRRTASALEIYAMNADGSGQTLLTTNAYDPVWSPDGSRIAFVGFVGIVERIFVMNPDGSGQTALTSPSENSLILGIAWSPDGSKIAFNQIVATGEEGDVVDDNIWVMTADGSGATAVTNYPSIRPTGSPVWAPDGSGLAFGAATSAGSDIYVVRPDGTGLTNLTNRHYLEAATADWSPDGTRILFTGSVGGTATEVFAMDADGSHVTNLTNNPASDASAIWQP